MRIAMVSEHASPACALGGADAGGQNVYVAQLSLELARRGHDVTVYTRRDALDLPIRMPYPPPARPSDSGGPVTRGAGRRAGGGRPARGRDGTAGAGDEVGFTIEHVPAGPPSTLPKDELLAHMPGFGAHLARAWASDPPDVVHAHFWMSGMAALAGVRDLDVPVVQTFHALGTVKRRHQGERDTSPPERVGIERRVARECSRVLATCTDEVYELTAMGVSPAHTSVVPCGVDTERFRPDGGSAGTPARRLPHRLLTTGRLVPRKGFDQAIRALVDIPETELLIAGGPELALLPMEPEAQRLHALAAQLGVADRVRLLGGVAHHRMPALLRGADAVLCTPVYEPFGIVPLEAMACGVPVVATAVGGHLDTVADRVTGRLVPPGDPGVLARVVRELLASPSRLAAYGAAGRERALARYSWARVADGAEQVYQRVTARQRIPTEVAR